MHKMIDACSKVKVLPSTPKPCSSLTFEKKYSCAAERLGNPQAWSTSAGAWMVAGVSITQSNSREQSPD